MKSTLACRRNDLIAWTFGTSSRIWDEAAILKLCMKAYLLSEIQLLSCAYLYPKDFHFKRTERSLISKLECEPSRA